MDLKDYKKIVGKTKIREKDVTKAIREYLTAKRIFHWKNWAGLGSTKGVPDILGVLPGGRALMIEIKRPNGKVSDAQANFVSNARDMGALAFFAWSVEDVIKELEI